MKNTGNWDVISKAVLVTSGHTFLSLLVRTVEFISVQLTREISHHLCIDLLLLFSFASLVLGGSDFFIAILSGRFVPLEHTIFQQGIMLTLHSHTQDSLVHEERMLVSDGVFFLGVYPSSVWYVRAGNPVELCGLFVLYDSNTKNLSSQEGWIRIWSSRDGWLVTLST